MTNPRDLLIGSRGEKTRTDKGFVKLFGLGVIYDGLKSARRYFQVSEISASGGGCPMSLYIKTDDYRKHGISKYSDPALIRAVVQKELNIDRVFVSFVNKHEYIRVDFLRPRPPRRFTKRSARRAP